MTETTAAQPSSNVPTIDLEGDLREQMAFQRRWRILSMTAYVLTTMGTLLCSAGATYFAAGSASPKTAAILAGIATVLVGAEKSMLFRDKWKFNLLMYTKLNVLRAKLLLRRIGPEQASDEYAEIMMAYASELPLAAQEQS